MPHSSSHSSSHTSHGSSPSSSSSSGSGHHEGSPGGATSGHTGVEYSTMENFGQHLDGVQDKIFTGAEKMQSLDFHAKTFGVVGQGMAGNASEATSHAAQQMHSVGGSVGQAAHNVRTMSNNYRQNEENVAHSFGDIHNPGGSGPSSPASTQPPRGVHFNEQTQEQSLHWQGADKPPKKQRDDDYSQSTSVSTGTLGGDNHKPSPRPQANPLNTSAFTPQTGNQSHSLTTPPESGNHPLKASDGGLTTASYMNSVGLDNEFSNAKRPGMGSALLAGDNVIAHSSMKYNTGNPNTHGVVSEVLNGAPDELKNRPQHGKCAEIGAISDYLHNQPAPPGGWTVNNAKHHFEQIGAATTAHRPGGGDPADACVSCQYVTGKLGISWYTRPIYEAQG